MLGEYRAINTQIEEIERSTVIGCFESHEPSARRIVVNEDVPQTAFHVLNKHQLNVVVFDTPRLLQQCKDDVNSADGSCRQAI